MHNSCKTRAHPLQVILMDHVDWLDLETSRNVAETLAKQVLPGGIVIWRSAAMQPPYTELIEEAGFEVRCISRADQGYMDRCAGVQGGGLRAGDVWSACV